MRKKLSVLAKIGLLVFSMAFIFSSCTKEEYVENPTVFKNIYQTVEAKDWQWNSKAEAFYFDADIYEITTTIAKEGGVLVAVDLGNNEYRAMPYTQPYYDAGNDNFFYETYDYQYSPGRVAIYLTQSDLAMQRPSGTTYFKITVIYNQ